MTERNERTRVGRAVFYGPQHAADARHFKLAGPMVDACLAFEPLLKELEKSRAPARIVKKMKLAVRRAKSLANAARTGHRWVVIDGRQVHVS